MCVCVVGVCDTVMGGHSVESLSFSSQTYAKTRFTTAGQRSGWFRTPWTIDAHDMGATPIATHAPESFPGSAVKPSDTQQRQYNFLVPAHTNLTSRTPRRPRILRSSQATANFDLDLNLAPNKYSANMPITPKVLRPPRRLTPLPTPRLMKSGRPNRILPQAKALRKKSLLANSDAAYCGYESGTYTKMHYLC